MGNQFLISPHFEYMKKRIQSDFEGLFLTAISSTRDYISYHPTGKQMGHSN